MALQKGEFNLAKFKSSTIDVLGFLKELKIENKNTFYRVLGVKWDSENDTLIIQLEQKDNLTA